MVDSLSVTVQQSIITISLRQVLIHKEENFHSMLIELFIEQKYFPQLLQLIFSYVFRVFSLFEVGAAHKKIIFLFQSKREFDEIRSKFCT